MRKHSIQFRTMMSTILYHAAVWYQMLLLRLCIGWKTHVFGNPLKIYVASEKQDIISMWSIGWKDVLSSMQECICCFQLNEAGIQRDWLKGCFIIRTMSCHIKHGYDTEVIPRLQMARENALSDFFLKQTECQRTPQMGQEEHYQWNSFTYLTIFFCTFLWRFNIHLSKKCFQDKCYNLKIITNRWWCLSNPGDKLTRA